MTDTLKVRPACAALSLVAMLFSTGCYLSVRGGPALHSADDIEYEGVGWNLSAYIGVQHDFWGKVRLALNSGGGATAQPTSEGQVAAAHGGGGLEVDVTLRDLLIKKFPDRCGANKGAFGLRWRAGAAVRSNVGADEGLTFTDGTITSHAATGGSSTFEVDTEWGLYAGKFNFYGGLGLGYHSIDSDRGTIRAFAPFAEISIGYNLFIPQSFIVLMSHYGSARAAEQRRKWSSVSCDQSDYEARGQCQELKSAQMSAWELEEQRAQASGERLRALCNETAPVAPIPR